MKLPIKLYIYFSLPFLFLFFQAVPVLAQRLKHGVSQHSLGGAGGVQRSTGNRSSINGGQVESPDRSIRNTSSGERFSGSTGRSGANGSIRNRNTSKAPDISENTRNKASVRNSGNTININVDRSHDVNVINNRNTVVRRNNIATYVRPPYAWGGRRFYCYHPYFYHPYRPFYWGPAWHPWGFFVAALATTAIIVAVEDAKYHYDQGVWYAQGNGGYTVVQAPVGGTVTTIPSGNQPVVVNSITNYYYGGAFYEKTGNGYKVVSPPAGAVVDNLPQGGEEVKVGDQSYVKVGATYYQPVQVDGKNKYEVTQIEEDN